MATGGSAGGKAYVVRDANVVQRVGEGEVTRVYPYTLKGLMEALEEARFQSFGGKTQVVAVVAGRRSTVIRRYEGGHEVPVT